MHEDMNGLMEFVSQMRYIATGQEKPSDGIRGHDSHCSYLYTRPVGCCAGGALKYSYLPWLRQDDTMEQTGIEGQALAAWENHARSWDSTMGDDGNDYFSVLELPALKRMISGQKRNRALDLATGNGLVARWLAEEGFSVVATDGARAMLEHAKARTTLWYEEGRLDKERKISFELLDVTNKDHWAQFTSSDNLLVRCCFSN